MAMKYASSRGTIIKKARGNGRAFLQIFIYTIYVLVSQRNQFSRIFMISSREEQKWIEERSSFSMNPRCSQFWKRAFRGS